MGHLQFPSIKINHQCVAIELWRRRVRQHRGKRRPSEEGKSTPHLCNHQVLHCRSSRILRGRHPCLHRFIHEELDGLHKTLEEGRRERGCGWRGEVVEGFTSKEGAAEGDSLITLRRRRRGEEKLRPRGSRRHSRYSHCWAHAAAAAVAHAAAAATRASTAARAAEPMPPLPLPAPPLLRAPTGTGRRRGAGGWRWGWEEKQVLGGIGGGKG